MSEPQGDQDEQRAAVERLIGLMDLEPDGDDRFRGPMPEEWPGGRLFGGLVASQALRAALVTVDPERRAHSLHAYFLRPGQHGTPVVYEVDRIRDGKSFTTREVIGWQHGEAIFSMACSFHRDEEGADYQLARAADVPDPDDAAPRDGFPFRPSFFMPFDVREIGPTEPEPDGTYRSTRRVWYRVAADLPDDPVLHISLITFMSDMGVIMGARPPQADGGWQAFMGASLDHALWFHRPARADEWMFYDMQAVSNSNARGLVRGTLHTRDGRLVMSLAQECLIRAAPAGWTPPSRPPDV